jgi:hypothetical protein
MDHFAFCSLDVSWAGMNIDIEDVILLLEWRNKRSPHTVGSLNFYVVICIVCMYILSNVFVS